jgi:hypothetical protein
MLVYCGGIYFEIEGRIWKKKAPLRALKGIKKGCCGASRRHSLRFSIKTA